MRWLSAQVLLASDFGCGVASFSPPVRVTFNQS